MNVDARRAARARGGSRCRRLTIGSSTGPVVFESGRVAASAAGSASVRPRPMKRARSVSYCGRRRRRAPRPLSTWNSYGGRSPPSAAGACTDQRVALGHELASARTGC